MRERFYLWKAMELFPNITLVGNAKTFQILPQFLEISLDSVKTLVVKEGDVLSVGKHELTFITAQMVHWPEVMFTYDKTDKILFTADAFDGEMIECDEGELAWVEKSDVLALPTWEGDRVFLERLLSGDERFFSIKLRYEGDKLVEKKITDY